VHLGYVVKPDLHPPVARNSADYLCRVDLQFLRPFRPQSFAVSKIASAIAASLARRIYHSLATFLQFRESFVTRMSSGGASPDGEPRVRSTRQAMSADSIRGSEDS